MLEVFGVIKTFRKVGERGLEKPLDGVSFTVGNGEIVGLMGKSGAGKSTIARILCGTLRADSGSASFGGEQLFDNGHYSRSVGFGIQLIPQQPFSALDPRQRIGNAVMEPLLHHKIARSKAQAREIAVQLLRDALLEDELFMRLPSQLSGGQAQRAVIARTLAVSPKLLIADEATSMLDMSSQAQIIDIIRSLAESKGVSILIISHDHNLINTVCDRSYTLIDGRLHD